MDTEKTSISQMAKELAVQYSTVRDWMVGYKQDKSSSFPGSGNQKPEDEEIGKLHRQLADLKEEKEILIKYKGAT